MYPSRLPCVYHYSTAAQTISVWRRCPRYGNRESCSRLRLKCDGTCAEARFRLSAKRTSPFKSAGESVQSTTASRGVPSAVVDCVWNMMAHAQKPDLVFRRNGRVHLNRQGRQFRCLLAAELCGLAVVMLDTPCSEVVWRVLATHPPVSPSLPLPCVIVCHHISTGPYQQRPSYNR